MLHTEFSNRTQHTVTHHTHTHTHTHPPQLHFHCTIYKMYIIISIMHILVHGWLLITYFQIDFLSLVLASFYYLCIQPTYYMMELNLKIYISRYMT